MAGKKLPKTASGCRPGQLFGLWFMDADRLQQYRDRVDRIDLVALAKSNAEQIEHEGEDFEQAGGGNGSSVDPVNGKPYLVKDGVAIVTISGPTTKYQTSFQSMIGGTSTMAVIRQLRQAANDPDIRGIFIHCDDAPGGTVAGAYEARDEIRAAGMKKPMRGHASELAVSAGYLFLSSAGYASANETAFLGSIGTRTKLTDRSKQFENEGVKVITVDSGKYKSLGEPGAPVTDDQVKEVQSHIDALNEIFITSIVENRKISAETIKAMEARIFLAPKAVELKLIDKVCSFEQAFNDFVASIDASAETELQREQRRSNDMTLLEQCRTMFANPTMSEADALSRLASMQADLTNARAALPKAMDPALCSALYGVTIERIDMKVEQGKVPAAVAAAIKQRCGWVQDGAKDANGAALASKPNPFMIEKRPELGGLSVADFAISTFDGVEVKRQPVKGEKTDAEATRLERTVPSNDADKSEAVQEQEKSADSAVAKYMKNRNIPATAAK